MRKAPTGIPVESKSLGAKVKPWHDQRTGDASRQFKNALTSYLASAFHPKEGKGRAALTPP
jgi:hypothetical protein